MRVCVRAGVRADVLWRVAPLLADRSDQPRDPEPIASHVDRNELALLIYHPEASHHQRAHTMLAASPVATEHKMLQRSTTCCNPVQHVATQYNVPHDGTCHRCAHSLLAAAIDCRVRAQPPHMAPAPAANA